MIATAVARSGTPVDHRLVAGVGGDVLLLPAVEGMGRRGEDAHAGARRRSGRLGPGGDELGAQVGEVGADVGGRLQLRRGDLGVQVPAGLAPEHRAGQLRAARQPVTVRIDEVELLLDAQRGSGRGQPERGR
jgi:hypothetical protein